VQSRTVRAGAGSVHAKLAEPGSRLCALIRRTCLKAGLAREEADGASIRGHLVSSQFPWEVKFASDSPVEGDGFELSVPRQKDNVFEAPQLDSAIPGEAIAHQMATA
jgi:hypothetical protein